MPSRGMAADDERPPKPRQLTRCRPHLLDDVVHGDAGTKVVAWNGDADPMRVQSFREVAERGTVQRLPVAAMNENNDWALMIAGEEIDHVSCDGSVGNRVRAVQRWVGCRS